MAEGFVWRVRVEAADNLRRCAGLPYVPGWSLGMVAVLIPAPVFGFNLGVAVLFHKGSTLIVVANALRLLAYRQSS